MKLAYFVHDLGDPAVHRRVQMLRGTFDAITLIGFQRTTPIPTLPGGVIAVTLGRTEDARLVQRTGSVLQAAFHLGNWGDAVSGATAILARQVEALALAALARRRFAPVAQLTFECLDIHRLMLSRKPAGIALRALERRLLRECSLLVVSSPAFISEYFAKAHPNLPPVHLLENKVLASEAAVGGPAANALNPAGPPWRIGWFGVIRCYRSLALLANLVRRLPGRVEVIIRGRPARSAIPNFDAVLATTPGLRFLGSYDRSADLAAIYGEVHFTWAIDFFEAGMNSSWLLPNRLYEGGLHGAVPIALRSLETGRWLVRRNVGLLLDEPLEDSLVATLAGMDAKQYADAWRAIMRLSRNEFMHDQSAGSEFAAALLDARRHKAEVVV